MFANMNEELKIQYFEKLAITASNTEPRGFQRIKVSSALLKKELPRLLEDRYVGVSRRVWNKLSKKLGEGPKEPES
jgi:hypothetical protein